MDDEQRAQWRKRLAEAYSWCCPVCKTAYKSQTQFEHRPGLTLTRHSECGHVLFYRGTNAAWVADYLTAEQAAAVAAREAHRESVEMAMVDALLQTRTRRSRKRLSA